MSKSKSSSKSAKSAKPDVLTKVKDAAITKPAQTIKAKSKELAKQVVGKEEKKDKKSKKKAKEPTPEPSESEESDSSESGDSESEDEVAKPAAKGKTSGVKKPASDSESSENSESESEVEAPKANGTNKKAAVAPQAKAKESVDESDSDESMDDAQPAAQAASSDEDSDDDSSDESSADEKPTKKASTKVAEAPKAIKADSESDSASDSDDDSDSSEESDAEETVAPKPSKRKAEEEAEPATKKSKTEALDTSKGANLFVGNLSWNVDEAWLKEIFEEFGELAGVRIVTERDSGRSKGFGYVEFVNAEDAAKAHAAKAGTELDGRAMNLDFANARPDNSQKQDNRRKSYGDQVSEPSDTLFLGNLSFDVGQEAVTEAFTPHGTILGIRLPTDRETGQPKGFGYVTFSSVDEAKAALEAMQGAYIENRPLRLDFSQPRPQNGDSPARGRGGFGGRGGARGGARGRGGRGGSFGSRGGRGGGRGGSTNRGGFGDFSGKKTSFN